MKLRIAVVCAVWGAAAAALTADARHIRSASWFHHRTDHHPVAASALLVAANRIPAHTTPAVNGGASHGHDRRAPHAGLEEALGDLDGLHKCNAALDNPSGQFVALKAQAKMAVEHLQSIADDEQGEIEVPFGEHLSEAIKKEIQGQVTAEELYGPIIEACEEMKRQYDYLVELSDEGATEHHCYLGDGPPHIDQQPDSHRAVWSMSWTVEDGVPSFFSTFSEWRDDCLGMLSAQPFQWELEDDSQKVALWKERESVDFVPAHHALVSLEETPTMDDVRAVTRHTSKWLKVGGILAGFGCIVATVASAGAAAAPCLVIGVSFGATKMCSDLTQARSWSDAGTILAQSGAEIAIDFIPGKPGAIITGARTVLNFIGGFLIPVPGSMYASYNQTHRAPLLDPAPTTTQADGGPPPCPREGTFNPTGLHDNAKLTVTCDRGQSPVSVHRATDDLLQLPPSYPGHKICALVFNPHPAKWSGGPRLDDFIVTHVARTTAAMGITTYRFNYHKGSGRWFTENDGNDAQSLVDDYIVLASMCNKLIYIGFSYGSAVAAVALQSQYAIGAVYISPPLGLGFMLGNRYGDEMQMGIDTEKPQGFIYGNDDTMAKPWTQAHAYCNELNSRYYTDRTRTHKQTYRQNAMDRRCVDTVGIDGGDHIFSKDTALRHMLKEVERLVLEIYDSAVLGGQI